MAEEDEYEILPHNSLNKLKSDLENLKSTSGSGDAKVLESVDALKESIDKLLQLFTIASEDLKKEEAETAGVEKKLGPLTLKVDTLIEQNQELARGLVVVADLVKDHIPKIEEEISHLRLPKLKHKIHHTPTFDPPKPPVDLMGDRYSGDTGMNGPKDTSASPPVSMPGAPGMMSPDMGMAPSMQSRPMAPPVSPPYPPMQPPGLPPLGDDFSIPGAPAPLPGMFEKPKKKGFLGGLFGKK